MILEVYTDGGSLNNPGEAASAFLIFCNNKLLCQHFQRLGVATNNYAEYFALILALKKIGEIISINPVKKVVCYADSSLMVNQLNGLFRVKNANIRELVLQVRVVESEIGLPIVYKHIPREKNANADALVKKALNR